MKRSFQRQAGFTLIELLIVIGIIAVLAAILLLVLSAARERALRVKCSANLRSLGQVMRVYAHDNKGQYPRVRYSSGTQPHYFTPISNALGDPFDVAPGSAPPDKNDLTAAYFLLIYYGMLKAETFICPATDQKPDPVTRQGAARRSNFAWTDPLGLHLSYSLANPYPFGMAVPGYQQYKHSPSAPSDLALAADRNDGEPYRTFNPDAPQADLQAMNSSNHKRKG
jgi:prepilin-type N-terminal cleavage/methylation domain-containing protein